MLHLNGTFECDVCTESENRFRHYLLDLLWQSKISFFAVSNSLFTALVVEKFMSRFIWT